MLLAELSEEGMQKVRTLEEQLVAVARVADLSEEQQKLLQEAEEELQLVLLAVEPD